MELLPYLFTGECTLSLSSDPVFSNVQIASDFDESVAIEKFISKIEAEKAVVGYNAFKPKGERCSVQ